MLGRGSEEATTTATPSEALAVDRAVASRLAKLDVPSLTSRYWARDEFLFIEDFLPPDLLSRCLDELPSLLAHVNRNFIPRHKKGGSVGFPAVELVAPTIRDVYLSSALIDFVQTLARADIQPCPLTDLHRCALYCYTEAGDHIGFHYDNSYYRDRRYTVLLGLVDESSSKLVCKLHTRDPDHDEETLEVSTPPGSLVVFNGDKLLHAVTPSREGERRFVVTMQYVTDPGMQWFLRFVSDMKDSIAYFGFRNVFGRRRPPARDAAGGGRR